MKKILKTFIVATICLMAQTAVSAEENTDSKNSNKNLYFNRGYRANIELNWSNGGKGFGFTHYGLTTSHGYSFGNGLYLGAGLGVIVEPHDGPSSDYFFSLPVFADLKYSFINGTVSPFVALRGGMIIGTTYKGFGGYLRPSVGMDIWRFSLTLSYELMGNPHRKPYTDLSGATATESWRSNANNFIVGIAFRF